MEQDSYKDYSLEIIGFLLKEKTCHMRGIARALKINHMAIARKINLLIKKNVLDFRQEGKNKVFFLKDSIEAKNNSFIYENYRLIQLLKEYSSLRRIVERIQVDSRIKLALIFGSYAKLIADKSSDIDIFIETNKQEIRKELLLLNSKLSIKIGKLDKDNELGKEIIKNHVMIKGIEEFYEKY